MKIVARVEILARYTGEISGVCKLVNNNTGEIVYEMNISDLDLKSNKWTEKDEIIGNSIPIPLSTQIITNDKLHFIIENVPKNVIECGLLVTYYFLQ